MFFPHLQSVTPAHMVDCVSASHARKWVMKLAVFSAPLLHPSSFSSQDFDRCSLAAWNPASMQMSSHPCFTRSSCPSDPSGDRFLSTLNSKAEVGT